MLNKTIAICAALAICASASVDVRAHHSGIGFDRSETVTVTGEITRFVWRNPHLAIVIDVTNESGQTEVWKIEGPGTTVLASQGFTKASLHNGDKITMVVHPMKSGKPGGLLQAITLASGATHSLNPEYEAAGDRLATRRARERPSQVEYLPPPEGETWQERERKTRPAQLPMVGNLSIQTGPGALDADNLAKQRPEPPFDLTGTWEFRGETEYTANYGWYEFKPHPEFTEKGKSTYAEFQSFAREGRQYAEPTAECYPAGMPRLMTRYGALMMLQYPTAIFIVSRLNNEYRVIWLDDRPRIAEDLRDPNWHGESIGHWEGNTLVIETEGFIDEKHLIQQGIFTGDQLKITERIEMLNNGNTIKMEFIMTDPEHWVGEWRHIKFRDRILRYDVHEAHCLPADNELLPGLRDTD